MYLFVCLICFSSANLLVDFKSVFPLNVSTVQAKISDINLLLKTAPYFFSINFQRQPLLCKPSLLFKFNYMENLQPVLMKVDIQSSFVVSQTLDV